MHVGNETFYCANGIACDRIWCLLIRQERIQLENVYEIEIESNKERPKAVLTLNEIYPQRITFG